VPGSHRVVDRYYYDPGTDQFLSVDPDVADTGQPYAYTGDDPLNATDPLGLSGAPPFYEQQARALRQHKVFCRRHPGIRGHSCGGLLHAILQTAAKARHYIASGYGSYVADRASTTAAKQYYNDAANATIDLPGAGAIDRAETATSDAVSSVVSTLPGANWVDSHGESVGNCLAGGLLTSIIRQAPGSTG
jgi:hypothetical protein